MDVYFFFKQRTDLIWHFYDAASAPFVETKRCIDEGVPPFDDPPYDESGEPAFLAEWLQADVERELVGHHYRPGAIKSQLGRQPQVFRLQLSGGDGGRSYASWRLDPQLVQGKT